MVYYYVTKYGNMLGTTNNESILKNQTYTSLEAFDVFILVIWLLSMFFIKIVEEKAFSHKCLTYRSLAQQEPFF